MINTLIVVVSTLKCFKKEKIITSCQKDGYSLGAVNERKVGNMIRLGSG